MNLKSASSQNGNVLFLILIAVALFAALSYAITNSTRTNGNGISKEKATAYASQILQFGASMRQTISRMKLSNGCTDSTLDFYTPVYHKYTTTTPSNTVNTNASAKCHLFDANGGNMVPVIPPVEALTTPTIAVGSGTSGMGAGAVRALQVKSVGTDGAAGDESANDLVFLVFFC